MGANWLLVGKGLSLYYRSMSQPSDKVGSNVGTLRPPAVSPRYWYPQYYKLHSVHDQKNDSRCPLKMIYTVELFSLFFLFSESFIFFVPLSVFPVRSTHCRIVFFRKKKGYLLVDGPRWWRHGFCCRLLHPTAAITKVKCFDSTATENNRFSNQDLKNKTRKPNYCWTWWMSVNQLIKASNCLLFLPSVFDIYIEDDDQVV